MMEGIERVSVRCRSPDGNYSVSVPKEGTVADLKQEIALARCISIDTQKLLLGARVLRDSMTIASLGLTNSSYVVVHSRPSVRQDLMSLVVGDPKECASTDADAAPPLRLDVCVSAGAVTTSADAGTGGTEAPLACAAGPAVEFPGEEEGVHEEEARTGRRWRDDGSDGGAPHFGAMQHLFDELTPVQRSAVLRLCETGADPGEVVQIFLALDCNEEAALALL